MCWYVSMDSLGFIFRFVFFICKKFFVVFGLVMVCGIVSGSVRLLWMLCRWCSILFCFFGGKFGNVVMSLEGFSSEDVFLVMLCILLFVSVMWKFFGGRLSVFCYVVLVVYVYII